MDAGGVVVEQCRWSGWSDSLWQEQSIVFLRRFLFGKQVVKLVSPLPSL